MPSLDQIAKFLVEEREQQALNVQSVHIGIGSDDDAVELQATNIEGVASSGSQHIDDRANLFVFDDTFQVRFGDIEWFSLKLEHGLKFGETPLTSTATGRVTFYDEEFRTGRLISVAA